MKILLTLALFSSFVNAFGLFVSSDAFMNNYVLHNHVHPAQLENYIEKINPNAANASAIASQVTKVASCLEIDPIYFLALVHKESTFYPEAKSPTGASGLTQMTGPALREIKDQLGLRGTRYARSGNIRYLESLLSFCMGEKSFQDYRQTLTMKDSQVKARLKANTLYSLYSGAILLKVYLAHVADKSQNLKLQEIYRKALERYNGDTYRKSYANKIIEYARDINQNY